MKKKNAMGGKKKCESTREKTNAKMINDTINHYYYQSIL